MEVNGVERRDRTVVLPAGADFVEPPDVPTLCRNEGRLARTADGARIVV